jgi:hypothetical protein
MPSSSTMQSARQPTTHPVRVQEVNDYRQTVYYDGAGLQIAESRRHSGIVRDVGGPTQTYVDFVLYPTNDAPASSPARSSKASHRDPAQPTSAANSNSGLHVTSAKRSSKAKSKPIIAQRTPGSDDQVADKTKTPYHTSAGPTSPPTPRLARLSTPDFSDLDEAPFCDCGVEAHVVKRCTACSKELDI